MSESPIHKILTFGYGNRRNYDTLTDYLKKFHVSCLIDVREKPRAWSRRWYGDQIKKLCEEVGIEYLSETSLGNLSGTNQWVSPDPEKADRVLGEIAQKIQEKANQSVSDPAQQITVLLLCAEMDYHKCHRVEVAKKLQKLTQLPIEHLK